MIFINHELKVFLIRSKSKHYKAHPKLMEEGREKNQKEKEKKNIWLLRDTRIRCRSPSRN